MNKDLEKVLKELNNGKIYGSQKKLADKLKVTEVAVSQWLSGKAIPSFDNIKKMSKIFNKSEKEIQKIFDFSNSNTIIGDNNTMIFNENKQLKEKIKLLEERNKFLEEQISFYKEKSKK